MNIEQLRYIVEVAKKKSFSEAAKNLYITQSALSQSIARLEEILNVKIFIRTRQGAIPTEIGKNIIAKANEALLKIDEIVEEASGNLIQGQLRIGTIPGTSLFFPKILSLYKQHYPNITINLVEKSSQVIINDIKQDRLDIGLIGLTRERKEKEDNSINLDVIFRGEMIVAVSAHSPLANKSFITPEEIKQQPIVLYNDDRLWEFVDYFQAEFGEVNILYSTNNLDIVRNTVLEGLAITIGPDYTVNSDFYVINESVKPIRIDGFNIDYPGMAVVYSKSNFHSSYIQDFINQLKTYTETIRVNNVDDRREISSMNS